MKAITIGLSSFLLFLHFSTAFAISYQDPQTGVTYVVDEMGRETIQSTDTTNSETTVQQENAATTPTPPQRSKPKKGHRSHGVIFKLKDQSPEGARLLSRRSALKTSEDVIKQRFRRHGVKKVRALKRSERRKKGRRATRSKGETIVQTELEASVNVHDVLTQLKNDPNVEWVEENFVYETHETIPNDTYWYRQAAYGVATNLTQAWDTITGSAEVVIGIIDTGVDYTHPDLVNNIWHNTAEIPNDGIDNDQNGYVDDYIGWDFVSVPADFVADDEDPGPPDNDPMDVQSHGTHVAGIAAAEGNNGLGIAGVSWNSKIMPLRAGYKNIYGQGLLTIADVIEALYYACDQGADIINMSFGSGGMSKAVETALQYCADQGVFLVAAAGNSNTDAPHYPSGYESVFSVAASTDSNDARTYFSNYGVLVDITAPGHLIYSTLPGGGYGYMSGTSMASPFVAGMAALVKSVNPNATANDLRAILQTMAKIADSPAKEKLGAGYAWLQPPLDPTVLTPKVHLASTLEEGDSAANGVNLLRPSVTNYGLRAENVVLRMSSDDPYVTITDDTVAIGSLQPGQIATPANDTWAYQISSTAPENYTGDYQVHILSNGVELAVESYPLDVNPVFESSVKATQDAYNVSYWEQRLVEHPDGRVSLFYQSAQDAPIYNQVYHRIRSLDGSWSDPVSIPDNDDISRTGANAVVGADGKIHVAFKSTEAPWDREIYYGVYEAGLGDGPLGQWQTQVATIDAGLLLLEAPHSGSSKVEIVLDNDDNPILIWSDWRDLTADIYWARYDGTQWSTAERLIDSTLPDTPNFKVHRLQDNRIILLYDHYLNTATRSVAREYMVFDGTSWSSLQQIVPNTQILYFSSSLLDSSGLLHYVYIPTSTSPREYYHTIFDGQNWSTPQLIFPISSISPAYMLVKNEMGSVDLYEYERPPYDPYTGWIKRAQYIGGQWSQPERIYELRENMAFSPTSFADIRRTISGEILYAKTKRIPTSQMYQVELMSSLEWPSQIPSGVMVTDNGDTTNTQIISGSFSANDFPTTVDGYRFAFGSAPGTNDLYDWSTVGNFSTISINFELIRDFMIGQQYFVSAQAVGAGGAWANVAASDGITYIPDNAQPDLNISYPVHGSTLPEGGIQLSATALDAEDGDLSTAVTWSSSLDGALTSPASLSIGTHILTASVTDSGGTVATDAVVVTIDPASTIDAIDLAINSVTADSTASIGGTLSVSGVVANFGLVPANAYVNISFYFSTDQTYNPGDFPAGGTMVRGLNGQESKPFAANLNLLNSMPEDDYYLLAIVDFNNRIVEYDDPETGDNRNGNNLGVSGLVNVKLTTDLAMESVNAPQQLSIGQTFEANGALANLDTIAPVSGYVNVSYYLSSDQTYDVGDYSLAGGFGTRYLSPGEVVSYKSTIVMPNRMPAGDYYLLAIADFNNRVKEIDDPETGNNRNGNNLAVSGLIKVVLTTDLATENITAPSQLSLAQSFEASGVLNNLDTIAPAVGSISVSFFLSKDRAYDTGDYSLAGGYSTRYMNPGDSQSFTSNLIMPNAIKAGDYYLLAIADFNNRIDEVDDSSTGNNRNGNNLSVSGSIKVVLTTDLAMEGVTAPEKLSIGETFEASGVLANLDSIAPAVGYTNVSFFLSKDQLYDTSDYSLAGGFGTRYLNPEQRLSFNSTITMPNRMPVGDYYLLAVADFNNRVNEIDDPETGNNRNGNNLAVSGLVKVVMTTDLAMKGLTAPSELSIGQTFAANAVVHNLDTVAPAVGSISVSFFLSTDVTYDIGDYSLAGGYSTRYLNPDASQQFSSNLTMPNAMSEGDYYLLAIVDFNNRIPEIDDPVDGDNRNGNNLTVSKLIKVNLTTDLALTSISGPAVAALGERINVSGELSNLDTIAPVSGSINVSFYLSSDTMYDAADRLMIGGYGTRYLSPGQVVSFTATPIIPTNALMGSYYIIGIVDAHNHIVEIDDPDNLNGNNMVVGNQITIQ